MRQVRWSGTRGSASWLSSHGRGLGPRDALKKDSRGLCRGAASSVHGVFQARVLEWGAIAFSRLECRVYLTLTPAKMQRAEEGEVLAALGLRCCLWPCSSCSKQGLLFVEVPTSHRHGFALQSTGPRCTGSVVTAHELSCSKGRWNLPGSPGDT